MIQVEDFGFELTPRSTNLFRTATSQYGKYRHIAAPTLSRCGPGAQSLLSRNRV